MAGGNGCRHGVCRDRAVGRAPALRPDRRIFPARAVGLAARTSGAWSLRRIRAGQADRDPARLRILLCSLRLLHGGVFLYATRRVECRTEGDATMRMAVRSTVRLLAQHRHYTRLRRTPSGFNCPTFCKVEHNAGRDEPSHSLCLLFNLRRGRFRLRLHAVTFGHRRHYCYRLRLTIDGFAISWLRCVVEGQRRLGYRQLETRQCRWLGNINYSQPRRKLPWGTPRRRSWCDRLISYASERRICLIMNGGYTLIHFYFRRRS